MGTISRKQEMMLCIPDDVKTHLVWVAYEVCMSDEWWVVEGIAELEVVTGKN